MEWEAVHPSVSAEAEFFEILNDFGNPLEIVREGISRRDRRARDGDGHHLQRRGDRWEFEISY